MISFSLQAGNLFQVLILLCFGTLEKAFRLLQLQSKIFPGSMRHEKTTQIGQIITFFFPDFPRVSSFAQRLPHCEWRQHLLGQLQAWLSA
jgi:hypothetical protein